MNIIKSIRDFIKENCQCLDEYYKSIGVDYLSNDATSYMIEQVPAEPWVKRYADGSGQKQCVFVFASTETYGPEVRQNLDNLGFYYSLAEWLEDCTNSSNLPKLDEQRESLKLEAQTPGYLFDTQVDKAQYRIQCRLVYFEERK